MPSTAVSAIPDTTWTTTAGAVKTKSARTTMRSVAAIAATSRERTAMNRKKAIPSPVPKRIVAPMTCTYFSARYSTSALLGRRRDHERGENDRQRLDQRSERIGPERRLENPEQHDVQHRPRRLQQPERAHVEADQHRDT